MLNAMDTERLVKASQSANLFVQDLQELGKADNFLLANIAEELLKQAAQLEQRLLRIERATHTE
jgi:hypothetical protein